MKRIVCIGDLKHNLQIIKQENKPNNKGGIGKVETIIANIKGKLSKQSGLDTFRTINQQNGITHTFIIRYVANITSENKLKFNDRLFEIVDIENYQENNRFLILNCKEKGSVNNQGSYV